MSIALFLAALMAQAAPLATASPVDWEAVPAATGSWSYHRTPAGSQALFRDATGVRLSLQCNLASRTITLGRSDARWPQRVMTSDLDRRLASPVLAARDPLLDAIAFTRGQFALMGSDGNLLVVPSAPEAARSIEDCRI